jgi:hypothetical protein
MWLILIVFAMFLWFFFPVDHDLTKLRGSAAGEVAVEGPHCCTSVLELGRFRLLAVDQHVQVTGWSRPIAVIRVKRSLPKAVAQRSIKPFQSMFSHTNIGP